MPMSISSKTRVRAWGLLFGLDGALFDGDFERQHDARHFAAGGDFVERLERLAGVGRNAVLDLIPAASGPVGLQLGGGDGNFEAHLHGQ